MARIWKSFALAGVSVCVALAVPELAVRAFAPQPVAVPFHDEIDGIGCLRPNVRGRLAVPHAFDVVISTSAQRFRGTREYRAAVAAGVVRIAALGDSYTFGFGAPDDQTYPARLEQLLNDASIGGRSYEVINAGVDGLGTGEEARWYDRWVRGFSPDIVILGVTSNDLSDDSARALFSLNPDGSVTPRPVESLTQADSPIRRTRRLLNALPGYAFLAQHSQLLAALRKVGTFTVERFRKIPSPPAGAGQRNPTATVAGHDDGPKVMAGEVRWLNAEVTAGGGRLLVAFLPPRESAYPPEGERLQATHRAIVSTLESTAAASHIDFVDLTETIRTRAAAEPTVRLYNRGIDAHPTPLGYNAIAQELAKAILKTHPS